MNWFNNLKVRTRLLGGFAIVAALGGVIGIEGIVKSTQISDMASQMFARETVGLRKAAEANMHLLAAGRAIRSAVLASSIDDSVGKVSAGTARGPRWWARPAAPWTKSSAAFAG